MKKWEIESDGVKHVISYKTGFTKKIIVDGEVHKAKSSNAFLNVIDYAISFGSTECRLVVIGNKADLAVNGTFLGSNKPYEPLSSIPAWIWVLVGLSTVGGFLWAGILSSLIGLLMSMLFIQFGLKKKNGYVIGLFIVCVVIQLLLGFVIASLLV